ncbi:hypothetical protein MSP8887_00959 [Marinomonas spartinae]|uniref:Uncharacterized protein n=1 Tax=Marinomonas spartinae TaxID=1792290 RepID=A0A1A8T6U0_9GAMM|nr:hypothetical protein MSP8886_01004 [Marinomonas spartinae]SBS28759.1 hypothetical protein MSP8887_00959 [Marinomonas spartinae]
MGLYLIFSESLQQNTLKKYSPQKFSAYKCNKITFYRIRFRNLNTFVGTDRLRLFL